MKGQFFIISTVIMIAALIMITNYLYDYGKVDMTQIEQMQELNYIEDVQQSLTETARISCQHGNNAMLINNLDNTKNFLEESFLNKGIKLNIVINSATCPPGTTDVDFTIDSSKYHIEKSFSV